MLKTTARTVNFFKQLRVRVKRAKRDAIYSVCGLIRRDAINRLRVRPGSSRPPAAPHAHTKGGLRVIDFHISGNTGIIGPRKFPSSNTFNKPVPAIHEFGGQVFTIGRAFRTVVYPKRPYMSKTVEKLGPKLPRQYSVQMGRILG